MTAPLLRDAESRSDEVLSGQRTNPRQIRKRGSIEAKIHTRNKIGIGCRGQSISEARRALKISPPIRHRSSSNKSLLYFNKVVFSTSRHSTNYKGKGKTRVVKNINVLAGISILAVIIIRILYIVRYVRGSIK